MRRWVFSGLVVAFCVAGIAAFALPGPAQSLWPTLNGLHRIAANIYSDEPGKASENRALIAAARLQIGRFFGPRAARPGTASLLRLRPTG